MAFEGDPIKYTKCRCKPSPVLTKLDPLHIQVSTYTLDTDAPDGHPRLARWMSTAENAVTPHQFRHLQVRSLLHLQDEPRALERELFFLDERDRGERPDNLTSRETAEGSDPGRTELMARIRGKWSEYGVSPFALRPHSSWPRSGPV